MLCPCPCGCEPWPSSWHHECSCRATGCPCIGASVERYKACRTKARVGTPKRGISSGACEVAMDKRTFEERAFEYLSYELGEAERQVEEAKVKADTLRSMLSSLRTIADSVCKESK